MIKIRNNVLVYPHNKFSMIDGGVIAFYQLAKLLDKAGVNVRMYSNYGKIHNPLFNKFYNNDFKFDDNTVVIYSDLVGGNPLKAKRVVRWMLNELGRNAPKGYANVWKANELVYFFNSQSNFSQNDGIHKLLTSLYIDHKYKDLGRKRYGMCYTLRKGAVNFTGCIGNKVGPYFQPSKSLAIPLNKSWFEIKRSFGDYLNVFNNYKFFVSYDPMTFMSFIAALCGCISIVNPCEGMDKQKWLQNTALWPYLKEKGLNNIGGIAYGLSDVSYAIETLPLLHVQMSDFCEFCNLGIASFISDIKKFKNQPNTVGTVFRKIRLQC